MPVDGWPRPMEEVHMCKQYMHAMLPAVAGSLDLVLHIAERMRVTKCNIIYIYHIYSHMTSVV